MAHLTIDLFSEALGMGQSVDVVLPQPTEGQVGVDADVATGPPRVLYLLHGRSDDHTAWMRYTSIERYAAGAGLAVVMPAVARSFYTDEAQGYPYWSWVSEELPQLVRRFLRVSERPEDTYVAGLSMGGYGALRLAFTHPDRYAGAASMSGALDVVSLSAEEARGPELRERVFGGTPGPDTDLFALLDRGAGRIPPLHVSCGTEDGLLPGSKKLAAAATAAGVDVTTDFRPGDHEWGLWDTMVREVIAWLPRSTTGDDGAH